MLHLRWPSRPRLLSALLALLAGLPLAAQAGGRRPFALLGPEQGLSSGAIICLTQDRDGFLWLGTENGLLRYEGGSCRHWSLGDGLPSAYIVRILPDPQGGVWVATLRGLVHFRDGRFEPVSLGGDGKPTGTVLIALDRRGRLWVRERDRLYVQEDGTRFRALPLLLPAGVSALTLGEQTGTLYVSGDTGLLAISPDGHTRRWGPSDGLPPQGTVQVVEDGQGRLWTGAGRHLVVLPPGGTRFQDESRRLPGSLSVSGAAFRDPDGSVWLATQAGALHLAGDRSEVVDAAGGLPFRWVRAVLRDREGTLWVLGAALARLKGGGRVRNYTLSHGPFGEVVWFITEDARGRLLVATDDGAARMGPDGLERIPGTEGRRIKGLALDPAGTLWMVTTVGPTLWLRPGARTAERAPLGELADRVNTVFRDHQGRMWLGSTRYGVLRWDPARRALVQEVPPSLAGATALGAYGFSEDGDGRLWVGTTAGLLVRDPGGRWRLFSSRDGLMPYPVYGVALLPDGSAWLHYQEPEGLTRIQLDGDRLRVLERRIKGRGLRSSLVYAVKADDRGQVWFTTDQGLMGLDPPVHLGREEGMASEDCAILSLHTQHGKVWVGTADGLVSFDSAAPAEPAEPPRVFLTDCAVGGHPVDAPFSTLGPVPAARAALEFRFAAPSYLSERYLHFQVRLAGLEDAWQDAPGRSVRYPALPGGSYRFQVRAANGDGPYGPAESLAFTVLPPWWKTWWAISGGVLAALALVAAVFRLRLAALARAKAQLETEVELRTRELRARNEELSEALSNVKQLSGLLPICASCKKIRDDRGYWNQLEHYISEHTSADFSHGICPDCAREMFPEAMRHREER